MSDSTPANDTAQSSRRKLMKALAVTGVAASAGLLPGQWLKPIVEMGVLPAHAQVTGVLTITGVTITLPANLGAIMGDSPNAPPSCPPNPTGCLRRMDITYDSLQPLENATTYVTAGPNCTSYYTYTPSVGNTTSLYYNGLTPISTFLNHPEGPACISETPSGSPYTGTVYGLFNGIDGQRFSATRQFNYTVRIRTRSQISNPFTTNTTFTTISCYPA